MREKSKGHSRSRRKIFQGPFAYMEDFTQNPFRLFFFPNVFLYRASVCSYTDNRCFDTPPPLAELELVSIRRGAQPLGELTIRAVDRVISRQPAAVPTLFYNEKEKEGSVRGKIFQFKKEVYYNKINNNPKKSSYDKAKGQLTKTTTLVKFKNLC